MNLVLCTRMMTFSATRVGHLNKLQGLRVTAPRMQPREGFERAALSIYPIRPPEPSEALVLEPWEAPRSLVKQPARRPANGRANA